MIPKIARLPEGVSSEKKQMRIEWRKDNGFRAQHPKIFRLHRYRKNVLRLTSAPIKSGQFSADDDVRIERIGDDVTVFFRRDRLPVAERDFAVVPAAFDSDGTAFLLSAVKPVRKRVVCA